MLSDLRESGAIEQEGGDAWPSRDDLRRRCPDLRQCGGCPCRGCRQRQDHGLVEALQSPAPWKEYIESDDPVEFMFWSRSESAFLSSLCEKRREAF